LIFSRLSAYVPGMSKSKSIFLVGPMGTGKTTIGRHLAKALHMEFLDSDHEIEERTGADITWIFDIEGEAGFRRRESAVIDELTRRENIVLATGGGVVLDPKNRQRLKQRGIVIYLHTDVELLVKRTARDTKRPLLQTGNPREKLRELMAAREPLYRELADITLTTSDYTVRGAIKALVGKLAQKQKSRPPSGYNKTKSKAG
jgi:shikimate kinase